MKYDWKSIFPFATNEPEPFLWSFAAIDLLNLFC